MRQFAVNFGPGNALLGILTRPAEPHEDAPLVLLTNAGVLSRQGPHRMNVRIARALAESGIPSFRFDLSGVGDSLSLGQAAGVRAQAVLNLESAMDWAGQSAATSNFIVLGVCSGAVNAYDIALTDPRIKGVLMFDGFCYRSRWTKLVRYFKRAMEMTPRGFLAAVVRRLKFSTNRGGPVARNPSAAPPTNNQTFVNPSKSEFAAALQHLVDRGTDVLMIFGGSPVDHYSYARQFEDVFGSYAFFPHVRCDYHPDIDHTFITRHAQQRMVEIVSAWAARHTSGEVPTVTQSSEVADAS